MERAESMSQVTSFKQSVLKHRSALAIIFWLHLIGLIGLTIPFTKPLFLNLVPAHLLLMLVLIVANHKQNKTRLFLFLFSTFLLGYATEWLGVHKYWLFGNYQYGEALGAKIAGVPLLIGINWFLLTYSTGVLIQRSKLKTSVSRILCGALVMVLLDLLIEPVASKFDYWYWANDVVPLKNYVCWFLVGTIMLLVFELFNFKKQSIIPPAFLFTQFIFFGILFMVETIFLP
jgi:putative membrane protein